MNTKRVESVKAMENDTFLSFDDHEEQSVIMPSKTSETKEKTNIVEENKDMIEPTHDDVESMIE